MEWGVSVVFGLPGDKNAWIMDNQNDSPMTTNLLVPMSSTAWRQVGCRKSKCLRRTRSAPQLIC